MSVESSSLAAPADAAPSSRTAPHVGEGQVVWTLWLTYGAFYFCRTNISAAVAADPGLTTSVSAGGLGLSELQVGWILASLKISYGIGQFLNGQLSERLPPRFLLAMGMFGSAGLNILFGLGTGFYFLLFVWACNGYFQSLGWTPCMRVVGNWIPIRRRGKAVGLIGTGYQVTLGLTYLVSSQAVELFGTWRAALFVPSALLVAGGLTMLLLLKERPEQTGDAGDEGGWRASSAAHSAPPRTTVRETLYVTLFNPALWLMGLSLALLNACRYGYLDWGLKHLKHVQNVGVGNAGLKYGFIALGAAAGAYLAGWATDRFFDGRRAPVMTGLLVLLAILSLAYEAIAPYSSVGTVVLLVAIGFCIFGPQVLLVGTAPADLAHRNTAAAAAGFVNFAGYLGAAAGDIVTGYFVDEAHGGWQVAIRIWAGWALAAAVFTALLWNASQKRLFLLPGLVPKSAGLAAMATAAWAVHAGPYPEWALGIVLAGAFGMAAAFLIRKAAGAGLAAASFAVLFLFASYVQQSDASVAWHLATAIGGCAIGIITSLMVLVDER
ncbi:MAG: MFS transporter [Planctomycetales bacterium]